VQSGKCIGIWADIWYSTSSWGEPHHRSAQVWHALSRNLTVLPATHAYHNHLCLPSWIWPVLIHRPRRNRRLSWLSWQITYLNGLPVHRRSPIQVQIWPDVELMTTAMPLTTTPRRPFVKRWYTWLPSMSFTSSLTKRRHHYGTTHNCRWFKSYVYYLTTAYPVHLNWNRSAAPLHWTSAPARIIERKYDYFIPVVLILLTAQTSDLVCIRSIIW